MGDVYPQDAVVKKVLSRLDKTIPINKGTLFNTLVSADTDVLPNDFGPEYETSLFRITVTCSPSSVVRVRVTRGADTVLNDLNSGGALNDKSLYTFDVIGMTESVYNIQTSVGTTLQQLYISEIGAFAP